MKKFIILTIVFIFAASVFAEPPAEKTKNYPKGTFKKARNGKIIQYDNNGKKIGTYKINTRKYFVTK